MVRIRGVVTTAETRARTMVKTYSEYKGFRPGDKVKVRPSCASGITLKPEFVYTVSRISEGETNPRGYVYLVESSECWNPERFEKVEGVVVSSPARYGNKLNEVGERIVDGVQKGLISVEEARRLFGLDQPTANQAARMEPYKKVGEKMLATLNGTSFIPPVNSFRQVSEIDPYSFATSFATGGIVTSYTTTTNVLPNQYYEKAIKLILEQQSLLPNIFTPRIADPGKQKNEELEAEPEVPQKKLIRKVRFDLVNA